MQEPTGPGDDDVPVGTGPVERTWVHPSEVGLETRSRSDRRRGAQLAAGLVVAGFGLLVFGVVMSRGTTDPTRSAHSTPTETVAASLAQLTVVRGADRATVTGVVLDGDGHVAVRAGAIDDADEIWASCGTRDAARARVVASDPQTGLAIVAMPEGSGRAAVPDATAAVGDDVLLARVGVGEAPPSMEPGRVESTDIRTAAVGATALLRVANLTDRPTRSTTTFISATSASPSTVETTAAGTDRRATDRDVGAAFDEDGRFVGLVVHHDDAGAEVLPATAVLRAVDHLTG